MFKFTLTLATSAFLLMSGTTDLFALVIEDGDSDKNNNALATHEEEDSDKNNNALATHEEEDSDKNSNPLAIIPEGPMKLIFQEASKGINPHQLMLVCKDWYRVIRENQAPQWSNLQKLSYLRVNPFMQVCMHTYWESLFSNGILQYTPTNGHWEDILFYNGILQAVGTSLSLKFSELNKDGTFDLSACGHAGQYLVITTNIDRFFKVGEENEDKRVILISLCHLLNQRIITSSEDPIDSLKLDKNPDEASIPINIFWRWGNEANLTYVDYLTTESAEQISLRSLFDNWQVERCRRIGVLPMPVPALSSLVISHRFQQSFSCQFLNRNKDQRHEPKVNPLASGIQHEAILSSSV